MPRKVAPILFRKGIERKTTIYYPKHGRFGTDVFDNDERYKLLGTSNQGQAILLEKYVEEIFEKSGKILGRLEINLQKGGLKLSADVFSLHRKSHKLHENELEFYGNLIQKIFNLPGKVTWNIREISTHLRTPNFLSVWEKSYEQRWKTLLNVPYITEGKELLKFIAQEPGAEILAKYIGKKMEEQGRGNQRFIRYMIQSIEQLMNIKGKPLKGCKLQIKGRWEGADRTKNQSLRKGKLSLQTINVPIDYAMKEFNSKYGRSSIKVWLRYE